MSSRTNPNIVVLMGGHSFERAVSLSSGRECAEALRSEGFKVKELDARAELAMDLVKLAPDIVFNALHGRWGEDGCVQGMLEWLKIPYTHSGILASSLAMDKQRSKAAFRAAGLPVADSFLAPCSEIVQKHPMDPPYVVKPNNEGSSCGIFFVHEVASEPVRLHDNLSGEMMVERYVKGRELTTTVMGNKALGVTEIITQGWYDYDAKYKVGGSKHMVPADVPTGIQHACNEFALRAHNALGCRGVSRTDFRWDDEQGLKGLHLLETNTQPGMTPTSLSPEQAAAKGIEFSKFCRWILEDASCQR